MKRFVSIKIEKSKLSIFVSDRYKNQGSNTLHLKGTVVKKIDVFKKLTPRFQTYELRGQGKE